MKTETKSENVKQFVDNVSSFAKKEGIDLSSGEDLSIALMNLISIEEHLFFSGQKLETDKYLDTLKIVRSKRTELMKKLVRNPKGEEWCISKHLLAASYRLFEVGSKQLGASNTEEAKGFFSHAFDLWAMFWGLQNLEGKAAAVAPKEVIKEAEIIEKTDPNPSLSKLKGLVKKIVDCCIE